MKKVAFEIQWSLLYSWPLLLYCSKSFIQTHLVPVHEIPCHNRRTSRHACKTENKNNENDEEDHERNGYTCKGGNSVKKKKSLSRIVYRKS